jgi:hypothetical protein
MTGKNTRATFCDAHAPICGENMFTKKTFRFDDR